VAIFTGIAATGEGVGDLDGGGAATALVLGAGAALALEVGIGLTDSFLVKVVCSATNRNTGCEAADYSYYEIKTVACFVSLPAVRAWPLGD
jgi:hypothetical protein